MPATLRGIAAHRHASREQIDVRPSQTEQLAASAARVQRQHYERREMIDVRPEGRQLVVPARPTPIVGVFAFTASPFNGFHPSWMVFRFAES